ncbi:MAG: type II toxin-antitoxin system RelB family antitoxin [Angustibacter sp.]
MTITIRLTPAEEERLERLSKRTGRSKSFYVREAMREHLDDLEDAFAAEQALLQWRKSGQPARPLAELEAELDV